jgi:hypothetical protein
MKTMLSNMELISLPPPRSLSLYMFLCMQTYENHMHVYWSFQIYFILMCFYKGTIVRLHFAHITGVVRSLFFVLHTTVFFLIDFLCLLITVTLPFFLSFGAMIFSTRRPLFQILTLFERVLKRDFLSSNFATTEALLGSCTQSGSALHDFADPKSVPLLPWIPQTTAAVALRLFELDASIIYLKQEKPEPCEEKEVGEFIVSSIFVLFLLLFFSFFVSFKGVPI